MSVDAELYALVHRGTTGDVDFYLRAAEGASRVLELGCGYGRVLTPLAKAGHHVVGLDLDAQLLAMARAALRGLPARARDRVTLVHADMRDFNLTMDFDRIFIPYNGFYCLEDDAQILACLVCVRDHLSGHGQLIWDAYAIDGFHEECDPGEDDEEDTPVVTVESGGDLLTVHEATEWDRDGQRFHMTYTFTSRGGAPPRVQTLVHHYLLTGQVASLCERAGLRLREAFGDFAGAPLDSNSEHMVCVAVRA